MSNEKIDNTLAYTSVVNTVIKLPRMTAGFYAQETGITNVEDFLSLGIQRGVIKRSRNLPELGGWIYEPAI